MNEPISSAPRQDLGRYLRSLDSIRFAESDLDICTVQARVELLISLLFGQTIPIGEHQFLDSDGFIINAVDLIKSMELLDRKDHLKVAGIFPFRVGIRATYPTIDNLIAVKLGDINYKLSHWRRLEQMHETRMEIKKKNEQGNFTFQDLYDLVHPDEKNAVDELKLIRDRFIGGGKGQILTLYKKPTVMVAEQVGLLRRGLNELISWNESNLYQQVESDQGFENLGYEVKNAFNQDLIPPAIELIDALKALHAVGISFDNRSDIRKNLKSRQVVLNDETFEGILEIYDSLYNSSAAKAVEAHSEGVSSARNAQDNLYIKAAIELSNLVINQVTSVRAEDIQTPSNLGEFQWVHDTNFGILKNTKEQLVLAKMPWEVVWNAYLDPNWQKSLSNLNEALVEWDNFITYPTNSASHLMSADHKLSDAISHHADNMQKILSGSILQMHEDSKTRNIIFDLSTSAAAGVATKIGAEFIINKLGFTMDSTITDTIAFIISTGALGVKYKLPTARAWKTNGQIREMFKRIYNPKS